MSKDKPSVSDQDLSDRIKDLEERQSYLETTVDRLAHLVESVDEDWKGPAAAAYKKLQRDSYKDAARIRQMLLHIEEATKQRGESLSQPYLDLLHRFQSLQRSSEPHE
jgi:WXG100 family type VII secretion target